MQVSEKKWWGRGAKSSYTANFSFLNPSDPTFLIRRDLIDLLIDPRREIDRECGYPFDITPLMYHMLYERDGISKRVVSLIPEESWAMDPEIFEDSNEKTFTDFEIAWKELEQRLNMYHVMHRADELSGIGRYGVLLLGLADGQDYSTPVPGINDRGEKDPTFKGKNQLLFVRAFDETAVRVNMRESNMANPRFGKPTMYTLVFKDLDITDLAGAGIATIGDVTKRVHWTRLVHIADNLQMSEVYGTPRMKPVFNRICDIRKLMGSSAEMFWKGGFPGLSFELHPGIGDAELDMKSLRDELDRYSNGLQRYLALAGMSAKTLAPQVADPVPHITSQLEHIAITLGIPKRVFFGSEEAKISSSQDTRTWNKRLSRRQEKYLTPRVVRPIIDRLVTLGVLPEPKQYEVYWPDLNVSTDLEQAQKALVQAQALAQYASGGGASVMSPESFLSVVLGLDAGTVAEIMSAQRMYQNLEAAPVQDKGISGVQKTPMGPGQDVPMLEQAAIDQMEIP